MIVLFLFLNSIPFIRYLRRSAKKKRCHGDNNVALETTFWCVALRKSCLRISYTCAVEVHSTHDRVKISYSQLFYIAYVQSVLWPINLVATSCRAQALITRSDFLQAVDVCSTQGYCDEAMVRWACLGLEEQSQYCPRALLLQYSQCIVGPALQPSTIKSYSIYMIPPQPSYDIIKNVSEIGCARIANSFVSTLSRATYSTRPGSLVG